MAESLVLLNPRDIDRNPDNPRLIFHQDELDALQESIENQGILVPLTVYKDSKVQQYRLLDGERRWRCALKLGLTKVPVIVQPQPDRLQNIMMMFAIHNARRDWDPLPTALKLEELERIFIANQDRNPTEKELAELASMTRGEVRRLRKLLALPVKYRDMLLDELNKRRSDQSITVDHVLETTKGVESLKKRGLITDYEEDRLREVIIDKFRRKVIVNTVSPRKLVKMAQAVERHDISLNRASKAIENLLLDPSYSIEDAFTDSAAAADFQHGSEHLARRLLNSIKESKERGYGLDGEFRGLLEELFLELETLLRR